MSKFKFDEGSDVIRRTAASEDERGVVVAVMADRAYRQVRWLKSQETSRVQAGSLMALDDYRQGKRLQAEKKGYWL